ncbi:kinase-like protein [Polyplosphaeria fusca]|uniref:Kinase-like protein n=1 Tax=Polyplosphaeria fusca TaxID=682080 RepID=A0A9P4V511_9PLEO|nr:kinase-like protein [Polyplosphaeria fusca]
MALLIPFFVSALAARVHSLSVPTPQIQAVNIDTLSPRAPVAIPSAFKVGDLLSFSNDQVLRRDNDTSSATLEIVARYFSDIADDESEHLVKRADPVWPSEEIDPEDEEDYGIFKCGDIKVIIGDKVTSDSAGGQGTVYKAADKAGKLYALKSMSVQAERDKEYDLVANKIGKNERIVEFFGKCRVGVNYGILMELVEGDTLQKKAEAKLYSLNEALAKVVMGGILEAVRYAHSKGVAHNDIKDGNVMIGAQDGVKLIDFGVATTDKKVSEISVAGGIRGPEAEFKSTMEIDPFLNDVWELGVLFVSMLTGKKPWSDAGAPNAKAIWNAPNPQKRADACKKEWPDFSMDFCDVLANVFSDQLSRKPLETMMSKIVNPNLKIFDDCDKKKTGTKREVGWGEMMVTHVEERGDEWVVRAVMY